MIEKISKYRSAIMGVAIIWIMLHHSGMNLTGIFFAVKRCGYGGVDIFLFLSGFGLAVSLSRDYDIFEFYKKRALRIFPHYIPILILFTVINSKDLSTEKLFRSFLGNLTGLSFWAQIKPEFNWYILMLFFFYLITPLFYKVITNYRIKGTLFLITLTLVADFCFAPFDELKIGINRLTVFVMGLFTGVSGLSESDIWKKQIIKISRGGVKYKFQQIIPENIYNVFIPFILITPAILTILCYFFERIDNKNFVGNLILRFMTFCGNNSLDIYLIHIILFKYIGIKIEGYYDSVTPHAFSAKNAVTWLVIILITVGISYMYGRFIEMIVKSCSYKKTK